MIDVKELKRLEHEAQPAPWRHDGAGGQTVDDDFDAHMLDDVRNGDLVAAARNALPAFLRLVEAMHAWDLEMNEFLNEQEDLRARRKHIDMQWSLRRMGEVQEKLDAATAILRSEFSFERITEVKP